MAMFISHWRMRFTSADASFNCIDYLFGGWFSDGFRGMFLVFCLLRRDLICSLNMHNLRWIKGCKQTGKYWIWFVEEWMTSCELYRQSSAVHSQVNKLNGICRRHCWICLLNALEIDSANIARTGIEIFSTRNRIGAPFISQSKNDPTIDYQEH